ncbi:AP-4 complex accessory subunit RUSC1 [Osmerus mordax]|uniref:AP-4 complex accessory subunit RUSC1 n=1 Tax=Osmerus mordax TaxID=8014 RepID=UPI0035102B77
MNPPPLTSLAALREMFQKEDDNIGQPEVRPSQKIGCSASEGDLWTRGREREGDGEMREDEEGKGDEEMEVRGRADGGRTLESRTTVSSPPLSLARACAQPQPYPYFLHSAFPRYRPGFCSIPARPEAPHLHPAEPQPRARPPSPSPPPSPPHSVPDSDRDSGYHHGGRTGGRPGYSPDSDSKSDEGLDSLRGYGGDFQRNIDSVYRYVNDSQTKADVDHGFGRDSVSNFDSLYVADSENPPPAHTGVLTPGGGNTRNQRCTTPYKNMEAMLTYAHTRTVGVEHADAHSNTLGDSAYVDSSHSQLTHDSPQPGRNRNMTRACKDLPPLPTYYLYHPKNCPLHRGAPPRLSPIGALSPPLRSGAPPPGLEGSRLGSPLFPRSHTLPALAAPLYYPYLYPPIPPRKPPAPLTLNQTPPLPCALSLTSWMGENVRGPVRGLGLSSLCLQEKRALVSSVSVAVEAVLSQFSSSRTLVQKALSGDSSVNPSVGRLALQCLCPALRSLLSDGLKPHQNDLISGRRPNSAWGLVQASTKSGPGTAALHSIQNRVGELTQLRQSKHRFNAFLLGLLNNKLLDFWLSHLQSCSDVLETFYRPTSFMRLSSTSCQPLFEELLLLLQPLGLLTFNLDLLFQHHHLEPANQSPNIPSPPNQDAGFRLSPRGSAANWLGRSYFESLSELDSGSVELEETNVRASSCSMADPLVGGLGELANGGVASVKVPVGVGKTSPQLLWVQEKEIRNIAPPSDGEASLSQQAGQVIQQGWGAVMRWGGRLGQNLTELSPGVTSRPPDHQGQAQQTDPSGSERPREDGVAAVPWSFGRLFGASKDSMTPTPPSRRPSQWLAPGVTVLTRMVSSSSTPTLKRALEPEAKCQIEMESQREGDTEEDTDKPRPLRSVRTLCDHSGTGAELSFQKGEELVILGGVDHDWIRCRQGEKEGLVPIGYTSLIM